MNLKIQLPLIKKTEESNIYKIKYKLDLIFFNFNMRFLPLVNQEYHFI
jgi:hypothetical protein